MDLDGLEEEPPWWEWFFTPLEPEDFAGGGVSNGVGGSDAGTILDRIEATQDAPLTAGSGLKAGNNPRTSATAVPIAVCETTANTLESSIAVLLFATPDPSDVAWAAVVESKLGYKLIRSAKSATGFAIKVGGKLLKGDKHYEAVEKTFRLLYEQGAIKELHHIATTRHTTKWTGKFKKLFSKAGVSMEDPANTIPLPGHCGPHLEEYHEWVFDKLKRVIDNVNGKDVEKAFRKELWKIKKELIDNPRLPYSDGGMF